MTLLRFVVLLNTDGNKVNLSSATVAFIKGVLGFVADGLTVNTPQARSLLIICVIQMVIFSLNLCLLFCVVK